MRFLNLHTHTQTASPDIFELVNQYPDAFDESVGHFSIGVHPWRINERRLRADLELLESKMSNPNCLAIGECGLDKRIELPIELQLEVFEMQLLLAEKSRKPVIVHCVAAYQEVIETKKRLGISVPMIIHGFSKNEQVAKSLIDNGFYLSFGKWLMRNPGLRQAFVSVPSDRFFLETDTEDVEIGQVYMLAANYSKVSVEHLKQTIAENFATVFNLNLDGSMAP